MDKDRATEEMNEQEMAAWEKRLRQTADFFPYPLTPDIVTGIARQRPMGRTTRRFGPYRLAWGVVLLFMAAVLLVTPQARAALSYILQIGAMQIQVGVSRATAVSPTPSSSITTSPPATLADIAGETSFTIAQGRADFVLQMPTYPPDLGSPDKVYWQERSSAPGQTVILVWLQKGQTDQAWLSLYQISGDEGAFKQGVELVQETEVNGDWAIWVEGGHTIKLRNGRWQPWLFVAGNVLIWQEAGVTYRLESPFSLQEAVQVAESLRPVGE